MAGVTAASAETAAVTGLLILLALVAVTGAAMWRLGHLRGAALQLALAALMIGAAGYAVQGRPGLAGSPREGQARAAPLPLGVPRRAMLGRFNQSDRWLTIADGYASRGQTEDAAGVIRSAIRAHPRDAGLWVGYGNALVDHAGMMTPAANFAYARARQLAPKHPAPLFFEGLALARSGKREEALALWRQALALTPEGASYRPIIEGGLVSLSGGKAAQARR
ncbi:tetratricopeptide repeat protein [Sphingomonas sp. GCM10030256]|uniref:tetratricopeptide repeat protein n=1 Tax=Sphingomonas sp. GCM10030256 TaxID=3273427 RepID=UPI003621D8FA